MLQLIPNEAMVKQQKGFSPGTNDWEFFALDTDKNGTKIVSQGAEEVNNFLGSIASSAIRQRGRNSTSSASRIMAALRCRSRAKCSTPSSTPICVARLSSSAPRTPPR